MEKFEVLILGSSSALPAHGRHPSAQIVNIHEKLFLIDCGEGTQILLTEHHVHRQKIEHIFISHLHGDHYFGLPGLITSFNLLGRKDALSIYSPPGLKYIMEIILEAGQTVLGFPIRWEELRTDGKVLLVENSFLRIYSFPVSHRIPTYGFTFEEKPRPRHLLTEYFDKYRPNSLQIDLLKSNKDILHDNGIIWRASEFTKASTKSRKYAYCADTIYEPKIRNYVYESDLMYHEATYMQDLGNKAKDNGHSTAAEAGLMAKNAKVKKLLIGHFSSRYKVLEPLLAEAKTVFENTELAMEGQRFEV